MKIPNEIISEVELELEGMPFGSVTLRITIHDEKPRFMITKERSVVIGRPSSGAGGGGS